jgi:uncharacterized membrane protein YvlD (DUF360 family)
LIAAGLAGVFCGGNSDSIYLVSGSLLRAGLTTGAFWLAFPQLTNFFSKYPPKLVGAIVIGIAAAAWKPKLLALVLPLILLLVILHYCGFFLKKR